MCNPEVFLSPHAFLGYLLDHMDPHATDLRALERNCDESLLAPFYAAACGTTGIDVATMKAESYLANVCMVDKTASQSAARGIAEGISLWTGTLPSWLDTQREERGNAHESRTSTTDEYQQGRKA